MFRIAYSQMYRLNQSEALFLHEATFPFRDPGFRRISCLLSTRSRISWNKDWFISMIQEDQPVSCQQSAVLMWRTTCVCHLSWYPLCISPRLYYLWMIGRHHWSGLSSMLWVSANLTLRHLSVFRGSLRSYWLVKEDGNGRLWRGQCRCVGGAYFLVFVCRFCSGGPGWWARKGCSRSPKGPRLGRIVSREVRLPVLGTTLCRRGLIICASFVRCGLYFELFFRQFFSGVCSHLFILTRHLVWEMLLSLLVS